MRVSEQWWDLKIHHATAATPTLRVLANNDGI